MTRLGTLGCASRSVALGIVGGSIIRTAIQAQAREARGSAGALATLAQQPSSRWLLGTIAVGLVSYGLFALVEARYRRMLPG